MQGRRRHEISGCNNHIRAKTVIKFTPNVIRMIEGKPVTLGRWYELRVTGSAGTKAGIATETHEGIAVGENGRLCSITSGSARRFESQQQAIDYLGKIKVSGDYQFEAVLCGVRATA